MLQTDWHKRIPITIRNSFAGDLADTPHTVFAERHDYIIASAYLLKSIARSSPTTVLRWSFKSKTPLRIPTNRDALMLKPPLPQPWIAFLIAINSPELTHLPTVSLGTS